MNTCTYLSNAPIDFEKNIVRVRRNDQRGSCPFCLRQVTEVKRPKILSNLVYCYDQFVFLSTNAFEK